MKKIIPIVIVLGAVGVFALSMLAARDDESTTKMNGKQMEQSSKAAENSDQKTDLTAMSEVKLEIKNYNYSPKNIKIKKGTKVTWTNQDNTNHDVTSDDDSSSKGLSAPLMAKGESWSFTFDMVGTYAYHCSPHPYMIASVEVIE